MSLSEFQITCHTRKQNYTVKNKAYFYGKKTNKQTNKKTAAVVARTLPSKIR